MDSGALVTQYSPSRQLLLLLLPSTLMVAGRSCAVLQLGIWNSSFWERPWHYDIYKETLRGGMSCERSSLWNLECFIAKTGRRSPDATLPLFVSFSLSFLPCFKDLVCPRTYRIFRNPESDLRIFSSTVSRFLNQFYIRISFDVETISWMVLYFVI